MLCVLNRPPARFPCRRCFAFISGTRQICDRVCGTAAVIVLWLCKIASIICRSVYSELRIISTGRFLLIILIGITDETSVRATVISGKIRSAIRQVYRCKSNHSATRHRKVRHKITNFQSRFTRSRQETQQHPRF